MRRLLIAALVIAAATVSVLGINRIVVTDGKAPALVAFKSDYLPLD